MKCHYEVLEISREADDGEVKSAYRKLALRWHPDKNLDEPDLAKEQFQVVQQAYEVLSDRQERAWYDAHRDQILRGASSEFQDKSLDVFQYFTTSCFKGYSDDEGGFYGVFRGVFDQIAKEDVEFMDEKEEFCDIPAFGRSDSDYDAVKAFYDYWMSYSTKKSYSWLDPYDIREGKGDRRVMKIIEKENKKVRLKAKKERNEEVRNLVAFVRKRDKRMQVFRKELEAKTLENRKKQEDISKQKRLERKRLHATEKQADWLKFDNVQSELEEIEKHLAQEFGEDLSLSEEDEDQDQEGISKLYCVACNKVFKTPKAFENHELSKKHKENVEKLRESMLLEEEEDFIDLDDHSSSDNLMENAIEENSDDDDDDDSIAKEEKVPETDDKQDFLNSVDEDCCNVSIEEVVVNSSPINDVTKDVLDIAPPTSDNDDFFGPTKSRKKKNKKEKTNSKPNGEDNNASVLDKATTKKQTKKERKATKKDADLSEIDLSHCCVTCKSNFPSKNKLFDHLKKTNHGVYLGSKSSKQFGRVKN